MSLSLYCVIRRTEPLSPQELALINQWEQKNRENGVTILCGLEKLQPGGSLEIREAAQLPNDDLDRCWVQIQRICVALSELRRNLGGNWRVSVDDHEIPWDETQRKFDPYL